MFCPRATRPTRFLNSDMIAPTMFSGEVWHFRVGDFVILVSLMFLFVEVVKSTRTTAIEVRQPRFVDAGIRGALIEFVVSKAEIRHARLFSSSWRWRSSTWLPRLHDSIVAAKRISASRAARRVQRRRRPAYSGVPCAPRPPLARAFFVAAAPIFAAPRRQLRRFSARRGDAVSLQSGTHYRSAVPAGDAMLKWFPLLIICAHFLQPPGVRRHAVRASTGETVDMFLGRDVISPDPVFGRRMAPPHRRLRGVPVAVPAVRRNGQGDRHHRRRA